MLKKSCFFSNFTKRSSGVQYKPLAKEAIILRDLEIRYKKEIACCNLNGTIINASLTAIIGPNGSGKSSLLKAIVDIIPIFSGSLTLNSVFKNSIAYLAQKSEIEVLFPITVQEIVATGLCSKQHFYQAIDRELLIKVNNILQIVGLTDHKHSNLQQLSGGQMQRLLFGRLIAQDAQLILLDEPFVAVDQETINDLMQLILDWHKQGKTIITVSHDLDIVKKYFSNVIMLNNKQHIWEKTSNLLHN